MVRIPAVTFPTDAVTNYVNLSWPPAEYIHTLQEGVVWKFGDLGGQKFGLGPPTSRKPLADYTMSNDGWMRRCSSFMKEFKLLLRTAGKRSSPEFEDKVFMQ